MSGASAGGVVSISVDAHSGISHSANDRAASVLVELLDRFHRHRITGTWAFADPAGTQLARRRIASDMPQQEVALLVDNSQDPAAISRAETVRCVVRRLESAAAAGIPVSTLGVAAAWHCQHIDLLTKHGITMIRSHGAAEAPPQSGLRPGICKLDGVGVRALCFGLWNVNVSAKLCGGSWMTNLVQISKLRRAVNRIAARGGFCHVQIDAASLVVDDTTQMFRTIDRFLKNIGRLRDAGRIRVETLRGTAQRLLPKRAAAAHSILRAA